MAISEHAMIAGQTNQYLVTKRRLLNAITPTNNAMSRNDFFSSRLDIDARFDIRLQKANALLFFLANKLIGKSFKN